MGTGGLPGGLATVPLPSAVAVYVDPCIHVHLGLHGLLGDTFIIIVIINYYYYYYYYCALCI